MIKIDFKKAGGLVPVITQDFKTNQVLMMAYMNKEAWQLTLKSKTVHYWSRSRQELWKKGGSSGNIQKVKEIRVDCDSDCVLIKIEQQGNAACHTGYQSCFYRAVKNNELVVDGKKIFDPKKIYGR